MQKIASNLDVFFKNQFYRGVVGGVSVKNPTNGGVKRQVAEEPPLPPRTTPTSIGVGGPVTEPQDLGKLPW
jgi:hypothetical protein